jgi:hypothetical protein
MTSIVQGRIYSSELNLSQCIPETLHARDNLASGRSTLVCLVEFEDHCTGDDENQGTRDHHCVDAWMVCWLYRWSGT